MFSSLVQKLSLGFVRNKMTLDIQSSIQLTKEPIKHQHNKHIEVHMHYIRQLIHDKIIDLQYCRIELQAADIFTKPLTNTRYVQLLTLLWVREVDLKGGSLSFLFFLSTDLSILYMITYHGLVPIMGIYLISQLVSNYLNKCITLPRLL